MGFLKILATVFAVIACVVVVIVVMLVPYNFRIHAARRAFRKMSTDERRRIIELLRERAPADGNQTICVPSYASRARVSSKLGGKPDFVDEHDWPLADDGKDRAPFIGQMVLTHHELPDAWRGVILSFFSSSSDAVRVHRVEDGSYRSIPPSSTQEQDDGGVALTDLPHRGFDERSVSQLLESSPDMRAILVRHHAVPERLLTQLLVSDAHVEAIDGIHLPVQGEPRFLQGVVEPACRLCQAPLRFLAQMSDDHGDVFYAFGCDAHPNEPPFVEMQFT